MSKQKQRKSQQQANYEQEKKIYETLSLVITIKLYRISHRHKQNKTLFCVRFLALHTNIHTL